jgi:hypothetical protein
MGVALLSNTIGAEKKKQGREKGQRGSLETAVTPPSPEKASC